MFKGSTVALVTPFRNGKVDEKALGNLVEFHIKKGTDALLPCGCTGEAATLNHQEQIRTIQVVIEAAAGRIPVMAGTGSNSTSEAIHLTREAEKAKADAALLISPYYNKPTQEGLYRHYKSVAEEVDIPIVLYNVPSRTGKSIEPETVARLSEIENIAAIKEASGSVDQSSAIAGLCDIIILSGDDSLTLPLMSVGAKGVVSVAANVLPDRVAAILTENMPSSQVETIIVDSLTAIITPLVVQAMVDKDAGRAKNLAAAFRTKALAMRQLQDAVTRWGTDVLWVYHLM